MYWLIKESYEKRIATCNSCEMLDNGICKLCGCFVKAKAILPITKCKLNKWDTPKTQEEKPFWFNTN